jgi:hypothetical protein
LGHEHFEERFTKLAHQVKRGSEIPQGELLAKIEGLQRKVNEPDGVADLDARFRELAERVGQLEKTNSLEARFTELAYAFGYGWSHKKVAQIFRDAERRVALRQRLVFFAR